MAWPLPPTTMRVLTTYVAHCLLLTSPSLTPPQGGRIMLGGISFQLAVIVFFTLFAFEFLWRYFNDRPHAKRISPAESASTLTPPRGALTTPLKLTIVCLGITTVLLVIRAVYRLIELSDGWNGTIITTEIWFSEFATSLDYDSTASNASLRHLRRRHGRRRHVHPQRPPPGLAPARSGPDGPGQAIRLQHGQRQRRLSCFLIYAFLADFSYAFHLLSSSHHHHHLPILGLSRCHELALAYRADDSQDGLVLNLSTYVVRWLVMSPAMQSGGLRITLQWMKSMCKDD